VPLHPLSLALGGLLGGGGSTTTQTTTVSTTASNQLAITPNNVVNVGGGVSAFPSNGGVLGSPASNAQASVTPPGQSNAFPSFASALPFGQSFQSGGGVASILTEPAFLIGGGVLLFLLARRKK